MSFWLRVVWRLTLFLSCETKLTTLLATRLACMTRARPRSQGKADRQPMPLCITWALVAPHDATSTKRGHSDKRSSTHVSK